MTLRTLLCAAIAAFTCSSAGLSCPVALQPFDPAQQPADAIVRAVVVSAEGFFRHRQFVLKRTEAVEGRPTSATYRIRYGDYIYGTCGPRSSDLKRGDQVVLYFREAQNGLRVMEWQTVAISNAEIRKNNIDARSRWSRRHAAFPVGGAISTTNPDEWVPLEDYPDGFFDSEPKSIFRGKPTTMEIRFQVSPEGRAVNCVVTQRSEYTEFDNSLCPRIAQRIRFLPPIFPEERSGILWISMTQEGLQMLRRRLEIRHRPSG